MKLAGVTLFFLGALLAAADPSSPAERPESASRRLGISFTSFVAPAAAPAPAANPDPVIVLPKFDVRETRIEIDEHRLLTAKGLLAEAKRRELSPLYQKTLGPLALVAAIYFNPLSLLQGIRANDAEAMVLYEQDERLRRLHESDSLIDLLKDTDPTAYRELKGAMRETFQLRSPTAGEH